MAAIRDSADDEFYLFHRSGAIGPPEVRRWIEREVTAAVALLQGVEHDPSQLHAAALAACTPQEAAEVYELIRGNFLLSQVFFELAREAPRNRGEAPLHALGLADMLRHTRVGDGDRLVECFTAINQAFQTVRNDPEARRRTTAFANSGSSCCITSRQWPPDRPLRQRDQRLPGSDQLTWDRARISRSTRRVCPPPISDRGMAFRGARQQRAVKGPLRISPMSGPPRRRLRLICINAGDATSGFDFG
jgi:hypothetical protein